MTTCSHAACSNLPAQGSTFCIACESWMLSLTDAFFNRYTAGRMDGSAATAAAVVKVLRESCEIQECGHCMLAR
jgi:hypothetical protein